MVVPKGNIPVKLFKNLFTGLGRDVLSKLLTDKTFKGFSVFSWVSINTYNIQVKVSGSKCMLSEDVEEKQNARFEGFSNYS